MDNRKCRFCGHELTTTFVDLGLAPLSNEYIQEKGRQKGQQFYPLVVKVCDDCKLVQALEYEKPENIFTDYKYFSSFSKSWLVHCKEYVDMIVEKLNLSASSDVVEIACNDGYLLQFFKSYGIPTYGIEPAENVAKEAQKKGIDVLVEFFSDKIVPELLNKKGKADLIIGNNVLAHVPDINGFVEGMHLLLKKSGTITMEFPHLLKLIQLNQFDTIYHEHFSYLSLLTVNRIFQSHGLKIYNVEELNTHGGSLRIYATQSDNDSININPSVNSILQEEIKFGLEKVELYTAFHDRVKKIKRDSIRELSDIIDKGGKIAAFGAAAKGNTFLNYCGIGRDFIDFVVDSNVHKQGLYLPGTCIPIVDISALSKAKPDYVLILPWNLKEEISNILRFTRDWGCKFITCIPEFKVF